MVHVDALCHVFKNAINGKKNREFVDTPCPQFPKEITGSTMFYLIVGVRAIKRVVSNQLQQRPCYNKNLLFTIKSKIETKVK